MSTPSGALARLRQLARRGVTGTVRIRADAQTGCVRLRSGLVLDVETPTAPVPLGPALVGVGVLTASELRTVLDEVAPQSESALAAALVSRSMVSTTAIDALVRSRLTLALEELLSWPYASCQLEEDDSVAGAIVAASLESLLATDDPPAPSRLVPLAPSTILRPATLSAPVSLTLEPLAWSLLCTVDGTTSVADAATRCRISPQRAGLLAAQLVAAGVAVATGVTQDRRRGKREQGKPVRSAAEQERLTAWRASAMADARQVAIEHARFSAEFEAYEEHARRAAEASS